MSATATTKDLPGLAALRRSGVFLPVAFPAWTRTRDDLVGAIAKGAGVVALVGSEGSGRTLLLASQLHADGHLPPHSRDRGVAGQHRPHWTAVDDVDRPALRRLAAAPADGGVQVLSIPPDLLPDLVAAFPDAAVVRMRPMASLDVRKMIAVRQEQAGRPVDAISGRATLRLEELCAGNPRQLDRLLGRAALAARLVGADQLTVEHVDAAIRLLPRAQPTPITPNAAPRLGPARHPSGRTANRPDFRQRGAGGQAIGGRRSHGVGGAVRTAAAVVLIVLVPAHWQDPTVIGTEPANGGAAPPQVLSMLDPQPSPAQPGAADEAALSAVPRLASDAAPPDAQPQAPIVQAPVVRAPIVQAPAVQEAVSSDQADAPPADEPPQAAVQSPPVPPPTVFVRIPRPESVAEPSPAAVPSLLAAAPSIAPVIPQPDPAALAEPMAPIAATEMPPPLPAPTVAVPAEIPAASTGTAEASPPQALPPPALPPHVAFQAPASETPPEAASAGPAAVTDVPPPASAAPTDPAVPAPPAIAGAAPQPQAPASPPGTGIEPSPTASIAPPPVQESGPAPATVTAASRIPLVPPPQPDAPAAKARDPDGSPLDRVEPPPAAAPVAVVVPPRADPAAAARLLALGKTLKSIGQLADARAMLQSSAQMGNAEAAAMLTAIDTGPRPVRDRRR